MKHIARTAVTSSQVVSIGHDPLTKEMDVEYRPFKKKGQPDQPTVTYRYQNVPASLHQQIIGAESIGREINQTIKKLPGSYPFRKLSPEEAGQA